MAELFPEMRIVDVKVLCECVGSVLYRVVNQLPPVPFASHGDHFTGANAMLDEALDDNQGGLEF